jgi:hypothetical protein
MWRRDPSCLARALYGSRDLDVEIARERTAGAMTTEQLTRELFTDKVGQIWVLDEAEAPPVELTLTAMEPLKNYAKLTREPFSLLFTSRGDLVLPQRLYALRHGTLGPMSIFLVPVGREGDVTTYQAVFN